MKQRIDRWAAAGLILIFGNAASPAIHHAVTLTLTVLIITVVVAAVAAAAAAVVILSRHRPFLTVTPGRAGP